MIKSHLNNQNIEEIKNNINHKKQEIKSIKDEIQDNIS